jgi:aminoglycoside/choline kinase family phosphotransferase
MSSFLQLTHEEQRQVLRALVERELDGRLLEYESVAPGLGTRRFFRLFVSPDSKIAPLASVIARVEADEDASKRPAGVAPEPELEPLRDFLERSGIPVPRNFGGDAKSNIQFVEDVGDTSLEIAATTSTANQRRALYGEACALIPALQRLEPPTPTLEAFERRLDLQLFESKALRVIEWALPWWLGRAPYPSEKTVITDAFAKISRVVADAPVRFSHRDLKAANIHIRKDATPGNRLVLIDLQGAFMAPPEYDLVCLLRDSHVPLPQDEVAAHLEATRPMLPAPPAPDVFIHRFTLLTLTRVAKDAAHYIHALTENDDSRYLRLVPAALSTLREAATRVATQDPAYERLANLIHELRETVSIHGNTRP